MNNITPVVKNLLIINVIVYFSVRYLLSALNLEDYFTLFLPRTGQFEPYQIVTSMFMHSSEQHLLFNMVSLFFLGPLVERILGPQRFLFLYFTAGILSALAAIFFIDADRVVGASGAIMGIAAAMAAMLPNMKMMVFPIPFEVPAFLLVGGYIFYDLYGGFALDTNIAHFSHVGGALAGIILVFYWNLFNLKQYR